MQEAFSQESEEELAMRSWLIRLLGTCIKWLRGLREWFGRSGPRRWARSGDRQRLRQPHPYAQPKPMWVRNEVVRLKALMPEAGCRLLAHHFNRRWAARRQMTVGKTYVAATIRRRQYLILEVRRKLKHHIPRPIPRNLVWGLDLMAKTDTYGRSHLVLGLLEHASRACLRLDALTDKSSVTLLTHLGKAVRRFGVPQYLRTDNEAVFTSASFRLGLWLLGIRQQRTDLHCPWQNGRIERFFGTVKRVLAQEPVLSGEELDDKLVGVRQWYNHERPHDHLQGRTPAEVWAGIDVFATRSG